MRNLAKKVCGSLLLMGGLLLPLTSVNAQSTTNSTFKPHGKIFAQFFGDYYYKMSGEQNAFSHAQYANTAQDMNAFDIDVYISVIPTILHQIFQQKLS